VRTRLQALLGARSSDVSAYGVDLRTGRTASFGQGSGMATASMVKLDILLTFLLQHQDGGTSPTAGETALATAMITRSDNAAASALWNAVGAGSGIAAANHRFGLGAATVPGPSSYWGSTTTNAADQVRLMRLVLSANSPLSATSRSYALRLLRSVESDQRWGVSAAADTADVALKNGWLPRSVDGGRWVVTSVGAVTSQGDPLVLAVLTRSSSTMDAGITMVEDVAVVLRDAVAGTGSSAAASASTG
jgi:beta-lactamase class A